MFNAALFRNRWFLPVLAVAVCFFLLGSRALNEPDEGRYAEIAREMVETGDWLVPHFWYVPHLDKPPMTYWLVALSLKCFGIHEWAARLPLALAALSGLAATALLGKSLGGRTAARTSVLLLVSSPLWFILARMLTTDIILAQFITWAAGCLWQSWRRLDVIMEYAASPPAPADEPDQVSDEEKKRGTAAKQFFLWQLAAWVALGGGFLTKGPVALVIPLVAFGTLVFWRRGTVRLSLLLLGTVAGLSLFLVLAGPWFWLVFHDLPGTFDFMVRDRLAGHVLDAAAKHRAGPLYYFFPVLAAGFLPWTALLGWLWRRGHWRTLNPSQQEGWLFLSVWAAFTFGLFSLNAAKLPAYILPLFPALALLVALRWPEGKLPVVAPPPLAWRACLASAFLPLLAWPVLVWFEFRMEPNWIWPLILFAGLGSVTLFLTGKHWPPARCLWTAAAVSLTGLLIITATVPDVETELKSNQTLRPLGLALRREFRPGDKIVNFARLAQGLPFYAWPAINATNPPYFCELPLNRVPFEFPGNRQRLVENGRLLPDEGALRVLLSGPQRIWVIGPAAALGVFRSRGPDSLPRLVARAGAWELRANQ